MCWNTKRQGSSVAILEAGYHIGPLNFYHMTDCVLLLWHLSKIILFISLRPTSSSQECELPESKDFFFFFFYAVSSVPRTMPGVQLMLNIEHVLGNIIMPVSCAETVAQRREIICHKSHR